MFSFNGAHFLNTPTNKFVLFLVFKFSLEVFKSFITSLSATTNEKPLFLLLFKTRNFPRLPISANYPFSRYVTRPYWGTKPRGAEGQQQDKSYKNIDLASRKATTFELNFRCFISRIIIYILA